MGHFGMSTGCITVIGGGIIGLSIAAVLQRDGMQVTLLEAKHIGQIAIFDSYSLVQLPEGMPKETLEHLKSVWVAGRQLQISHGGEMPPEVTPPKPRLSKPYKDKKPSGDKPSRRKIRP